MNLHRLPADRPSLQPVTCFRLFHAVENALQGPERHFSPVFRRDGLQKNLVRLVADRNPEHKVDYGEFIRKFRPHKHPFFRGNPLPRVVPLHGKAVQNRDVRAGQMSVRQDLQTSAELLHRSLCSGKKPPEQQNIFPAYAFSYCLYFKSDICQLLFLTMTT